MICYLRLNVIIFLFKLAIFFYFYHYFTLDGPLLSISPNKQTLILNETDKLNLTCFVDSNPLEHGIWNIEKTNQAKYFKTTKYSKLPKSSISYTNFYISNLKSLDSANYSCCLESNLTVCKSIQVIVQSNFFW